MFILAEYAKAQVWRGCRIQVPPVYQVVSAFELNFKTKILELIFWNFLEIVTQIYVFLEIFIYCLSHLCFTSNIWSRNNFFRLFRFAKTLITWIIWFFQGSLIEKIIIVAFFRTLRFSLV